MLDNRWPTAKVLAMRCGIVGMTGRSIEGGLVHPPRLHTF
jgi:hypothetical protein